jgi:hypothetical protein
MSRLDDMRDALERAECDALERIRKAYAVRFLAEFRAMLAPFNLSRHDVRISSGMGSACLTINGEVWTADGRLDHRMDDVLCELRVISANLSHEWANYLDGQSLTK